MSSSKEDSSTVPQCGVCKKFIMKNVTKCNICNKNFHPSCSAKLKKCCEIELSSSNNNELRSEDQSPLFEMGVKNLTADSTQPELLLRIIYELESKNNLLIENNSLLKLRNSFLESTLKSKDMEIKNLRKELFTYSQDKQFVVIGDPDAAVSVNSIPSLLANSVTDDPQRLPPKVNVTLAGSGTAAPLSSGIHTFTSREVNASIKSAQNFQKNEKLMGPINTNSDKSLLPQKKDSDWDLVNRKKNLTSRKALVVGSYSGSTNVEGLDKFKAFHVSNLKPDTKVEDLENFLKKNFTNVKCVKLESRYPETYSSFKVLISDLDYDKALVASNWPNKANIHRFFHRKEINQNSKK